MTKKAESLLYRPFSTLQMKPSGVPIKVEATEAEREAIAADFGLAGISSLVGEYKLTGRSERIKVVGTVKADVQPICVVSLEAFESHVKEDVMIVFADHERRRPQTETDGSEDLPDPIVGGKIDLGALTLEFLALGLDPYPRKPGISFEQAKDVTDVSEDSPRTLGALVSEKTKSNP